MTKKIITILIAMIMAVTIFTPSASAQQSDGRMYVTIQGHTYLRCNPVTNYLDEPRRQSGWTNGNASDMYMIAMDPVADRNSPECLAFGNEIVFQTSALQNALYNDDCNNKIKYARKIVHKQPSVRTVSTYTAPAETVRPVAYSAPVASYSAPVQQAYVAAPENLITFKSNYQRGLPTHWRTPGLDTKNAMAIKATPSFNFNAGVNYQLNPADFNIRQGDVTFNGGGGQPTPPTEPPVQPPVCPAGTPGCGPVDPGTPVNPVTPMPPTTPPTTPGGPVDPGTPINPGTIPGFDPAPHWNPPVEPPFQPVPIVPNPTPGPAQPGTGL